MKLSEIGLKHLFLVLLIAGTIFAVYRHYSYIYSLSPVMRAVYENRNDFPQKNGIWVLDPSKVVNEFVHPGMTEQEVRTFIEEAGMIVSPNNRRSPSEIKKYESRIVAYQYVRSGFAGWHILLAGNYTFRISFDFNHGVVENISSVVIINSL